jgi:tellurite methyltransferase
MAQRGLCAVGVDLSLDSLRAAQAAQTAAGAPRARWICADLECFALPDQTFGVVACFYYRDPSLYSTIRATLRPGGLLFYETFTRDQLQFERGPRNPAHLLKPGELLGSFGDWEVVLYQETSKDQAVASLVARKPLSSNCD